MKRFLTLAAACIAVIPLAHASEISFQTRFSGLPSYSDANSLRAAVESLMAAPPSAGYCDAAPSAWSGLSNQATCGGGAYNMAFRIGANFSVGAAEAGLWNFRVGPDFGLGGALFIDGTAVDYDTSDLWWAGNYGNTSELLTASINLAAGNHEIVAYGFEYCCSGAQQAQFLAHNSREWVVFGADDGHDPSSVPEPGTLALLGLSLAGLATARRRRG